MNSTNQELINKQTIVKNLMVDFVINQTKCNFRVATGKELDITGGKKEGDVLGELGGAISLVVYQ